MRRRKKFYRQPPKNNNAYLANTFDDLLLGKFYNIYGEKVEPYKGMIVIVKFSKFKLYLLKENEISKPENWMLIGECIEKNT
jgi:hypothetical protein